MGYKPAGSPKTARKGRSTYVSKAQTGRAVAAASQRRKGYGSVARARGAAVTGEMKYFDCDKSLTTIGVCTTTWVAGTLADPATTINLGDAAVASPACLFAPKVSAALNGRIGRKVKVLKVKVRGTISVGAQTVAAIADNGAKVRLMLVMDKQTNAAQMTSAALMNDATAAETTLNSYQNPNNFGRFVILKEKMFKFGNMSMTGAAAVIEQAGDKQYFKMDCSFKTPVGVNFNATNGGTVADIIDNSFHIICAVDNSLLACQIGYYSRVCYKE